MAETYPTTPTSKTALRGMSAKEIIANRKQTIIGPRPLLSFPAGLGVHCTLMRFFQYSYGGTSGSTESNLANVVLPLPRQIQDSFKINIAGDELGILGAGAAQAASDPGSIDNIAKSFGANTVEALSGLSLDNFGDVASIQSAISLGTNAAQFLAKAMAAKIAPDIVNGISAGRGTAINPFATLVFKGVDLKIHSLEWLLSPESESESRTLKNIIQTLQRMVLPKVESAIGFESTITAVDRGIMRYPAMVDIYFQGIDMNYYFKFKTSMISQLNVDYTPNGIAINKGGRPSAIRITMTLNEAYIHTSDDYQESDLSNQAIVEAANEILLRESQDGVPPNPATNDSQDNSGDGTASGSPLGNGENDSNATVPAPNGQSNAQPPSSTIKADEYTVTGPNGTTTYTRSELNASGVTDAEILANPDKYVPGA
jgi:hypothetical protein